MLVDSEVYKFFVPPDKIVKLHELVESMGVMPEATIRALASVVGKVMSMQLAVPAVRMMSAGLYKLVRPEGNWDRSVPLTRVVLSELAGAVDWVRQYSKFGNPIRRFTGMKELRICVDAGTGFGWRIDGADRTAEFEGDVLAKSLEWGVREEELFQPWKETSVACVAEVFGVGERSARGAFSVGEARRNHYSRLCEQGIRPECSTLRYHACNLEPVCAAQHLTHCRAHGRGGDDSDGRGFAV
jgi:hypothetical protein